MSEAEEEVISESTSDDERQVRVYDRTGDFIITVPAKARLTFGYFNPASPSGTQDGHRYGPDNAARQTALRVYRTKEDQLACFMGVKGFRDLSIRLTRLTQKVTVERRVMQDDEAAEWYGSERRELTAKTEDDFL
jgi:hypothetical protein